MAASAVHAQVNALAAAGGFMPARWLLVLLVLVLLPPLAALAPAGAAERAQSGIAAVYSYKGSRTASGETANPTGLTAAHRTLPFGTMVRVTNRRNQHAVVVRINDRGPFGRGRVIDVTPAAARQLGFSGLAQVDLEVIGAR
jgi:rare lipoprotein A